MAVARDDDAERVYRIDRILEELHLNAEDLSELAKQARQRVRLTREETRLLRDVAQQSTRRLLRKRR